MTSPKNAGVTEGCGECPLHDDRARRPSRREFLRQAGLLVTALGLTAARVEAAAAMTAQAGMRRTERRYAIPATDGVAMDHDNSVIIARAAGRVYAFSLACPHQNTALRWEPADNEFRCPKHKSRYRPEGTFIAGRATRAMDRLAIRREGDAIVVDLDSLYQQDENAKEWASAFVAV